MNGKGSAGASRAPHFGDQDAFSACGVIYGVTTVSVNV